MKLRLRSFETKETMKVEVPSPCNIQRLRELVSQTFPSPTIRFSLNRKDELTTSPEESIQSVGIASGDLIYVTTNPDGFSSATPSVPKLEQPSNPQTLKPNSPKQEETLNLESLKGKTVGYIDPNSALDSESGKGKTAGSINSNSNSKETAESMEIDDDTISVGDVGKSFSVPGFLRKVFTEELGDDGGLNHKLLAIAIRAVLLESGFVEFDPASNIIKTNNLDLHGNWYLASFYYTLPDIINKETIETGVTNYTKIKFLNLGKYCKIYGSLVNGSGMMHSVLLDEDRLVPFLNVVWANCGPVVETMEENHTVSSVLPEKEVFDFWRKVKDGLALPLMIDLCEKSGLDLPPCFMQLPTELKLKILELLPGVEIAKVSSLCSELRYLASSEDLWKQKYVEQFGNAEASEGWRSFKERFAKSWEGRKRRKLFGRAVCCSVTRRGMPYVPRIPGYFPWVIGGEYDLGPNFGQLGQFGGGGGVPRQRNFVPSCHLGRREG